MCHVVPHNYCAAVLYQVLRTVLVDCRLYCRLTNQVNSASARCTDRLQRLWFGHAYYLCTAFPIPLASIGYFCSYITIMAHIQQQKKRSSQATIAAG